MLRIPRRPVRGMTHCTVELGQFPEMQAFREQECFLARNVPNAYEARRYPGQWMDGESPRSDVQMLLVRGRRSERCWRREEFCTHP